MNGMTRCNCMLARVSQRDGTRCDAPRGDSIIRQGTSTTTVSASATDRGRGVRQIHRRFLWFPQKWRVSGANTIDGASPVGPSPSNRGKSWTASVLTVVGDRQLVSAERADRKPSPSQWVVSWGARCPFLSFLLTTLSSRCLPYCLIFHSSC